MTTDDLVEAPPLPTGRRFALVIATSTYDHPEYHDLPATAQDATAMRDMLGDPDICAFEVQTLVDRTAPEIRIAINKVFNERRAGDLVLVYFSGHGVKDDDGRLHFVATDTDPATLQATAVSSRYLLDLSGAAAADRQIIVLDCCFSGAYDAKGVGFADLLTLDEMEDETASIGRYFITASRGAEYSFQKRRRDGEVAGSVFTTAFVDGVRTGLADVNNTGRITIQDAYRHAFTIVTRDGRRQNPQFNLIGGEGRGVVFARNPVGIKASARGLSQPLAAPARPAQSRRLHAVQALGELLHDESPPKEAAARRHLEGPAAAGRSPLPPPAGR